MEQPRTTTQWSQASVRHDDLVGTAAADWPDSHRALQERAGLGDDWLVVALELTGSYRSSRAAALAVPMPPTGLYVDWARLVDDDGRLAVRRFPVRVRDVDHDPGGGLGLLTELKRWSVHLTVAPLRDVPLVVLVDQDPPG